MNWAPRRPQLRTRATWGPYYPTAGHQRVPLQQVSAQFALGLVQHFHQPGGDGLAGGGMGVGNRMLHQAHPGTRLKNNNKKITSNLLSEELGQDGPPRSTHHEGRRCTCWTGLPSGRYRPQAFAGVWVFVSSIKVPIYSFYITHIASCGAESTPFRSKVKRHLGNSFKKIIGKIC